ncbi:DUF3108 domain-containing protein [Undibacterium sp. TJN25]|uniref:DUF3108 domain-containing protein n=1 Tax=Undibacterium sp. TJN25 TaxID=3413056 RepID=UPI003BEF5122
MNKQTRRHSRHWVVPLAVTALLHILVLYWADEKISLPRPKEQVERTVEISLTPRPADPVRAESQPKPVEAVKQRPRPVQRPATDTDFSSALSSQTPATEPTESATAAAEAAPAEIAQPVTPPPDLMSNMPEVPVAPATDKPARDQTPHYAVAPPPSARLVLELVNTKPGQPNPYLGEGEINWQTGNGKYRMTMKAGLKILFASVNLLSMRSEGLIDANGIAPVTSSETRRGRSETATHFNRDEKTITFSASTKTMALNDGAQDKNTIIMQLAGIGNADPKQMQPGKEFAIQVGEDREATVFQFIVQGQETITTKLGTLHTWHLVRPPRPGSYNSRLDVWLAPELQWYPVQIRNTETSGAVTTQTVVKITQ